MAPASSSTTSFVLVDSPNPSESSSSSANDGRVVRFDTECVLIPEYVAHRGPRVVTKSYSLPLWKRRGPGLAAPASDSESTDDPPSILSSSPEETHVVLRVPLPSFVRRPPLRAPSRSPSTSPIIPLSPCLVQRLTASPSPSSETQAPTFPPPTAPTRRPSLPIYQRRPDDHTIPLRACCPDCVPVTDQCLKEGSRWQEKFTKGARRRRSASLDSTAASTGGGGNAVGAQKMPFTPSSFDARMPTPTFAITVDEVDKRRRSQDSLANAAVGVRGEEGDSENERKRSCSTHDRDHISTEPSSDSSISSHSSSDYTHIHTHIRKHTHLQPTIQTTHLIPPRKSSPIAEEDENELFPLPSPRRSPTGSSSSSRSPSATSSPRVLSPRPSPSVSPKVSPGSSPNASSSCLQPSNAAPPGVLTSASGLKVKKKKSRSNESVSSDEMLASGAFVRKKAANGNENMGVNNVADSPSPSGASTPRAGDAKSKPLLGLSITFPSVRMTNVDSDDPLLSHGEAGGDTMPNSPVVNLDEEESGGLSSSLTSSSTSMSTSEETKSPITPTSSTSHSLFPDLSPKPPASTTSTPAPRSVSATSPKSAFPRMNRTQSNPNMRKTNRRLASFGLPFLKAGEVIRGASVDVLRGVSSISGPGGTSTSVGGV